MDFHQESKESSSIAEQDTHEDLKLPASVGPPPNEPPPTLDKPPNQGDGGADDYMEHQLARMDDDGWGSALG